MKILLQGEVFKHPDLWWTLLIQTCTKIPISIVPLHWVMQWSIMFSTAGDMYVCLNSWDDVLHKAWFCLNLVVSHYLSATQYVAIYSIWPMNGLPGLERALSRVPGMLPAVRKWVDPVYFSRKFFLWRTSNWPWGKSVLCICII